MTFGTITPPPKWRLLLGVLLPYWVLRRMLSFHSWIMMRRLRQRWFPVLKKMSDTGMWPDAIDLMSVQPMTNSVEDFFVIDFNIHPKRSRWNKIKSILFSAILCASLVGCSIGGPVKDSLKPGIYDVVTLSDTMHVVYQFDSRELSTVLWVGLDPGIQFQDLLNGKTIRLHNDVDSHYLKIKWRQDAKSSKTL
jgi:hypothetical protein